MRRKESSPAAGRVMMRASDGLEGKQCSVWRDGTATEPTTAEFNSTSPKQCGRHNPGNGSEPKWLLLCLLSSLRATPSLLAEIIEGIGNDVQRPGRRTMVIVWAVSEAVVECMSRVLAFARNKIDSICTREEECNWESGRPTVECRERRDSFEVGEIGPNLVVVVTGSAITTPVNHTMFHGQEHTRRLQDY